jgi:hypothetical protein
MRRRRTLFRLAAPVFALILLAAAFFLPADAPPLPGPSTALAEDGGGGSSSDGSSAADAASQPPPDGGGGGGSGLLAAISELVDALKRFVEFIERVLNGEILDIFTEWLGRQFQGVLDMVSGAFGVSFLATPRLHSIGWVHRWWSWFFWLSFGLLFAATVWAGIRVFAASARPGQDMWRPLKVVGLALLSALVSLWAADFLVFLCNAMGNALLRDALNAARVSPGTVDSGRAVLGLMFASDPSLAGRPLYEILIDKQNGGSFFLLVIVMTEVLILALLTLARHFALCLLAVTAPFYFVGSALAARPEPLVGWWFLAARTAGFQLLNDVVWVFVVNNRFAENSSASRGGFGWEFGADAHFVAVVALGLLIWATWKYWLRPTWKVIVADPITLGGGATLVGIASLASGAARAAGLLGKVFRLPALEAGGILLGETAEKAKKKGEEWTERGKRGLKESFWKGARDPAEGAARGGLGGLLDRIAPVPKRLQSTKVVRIEGPTWTEGGVKWSAIRVPAGEARNAAEVLRKAGVPDAAVRTDPVVTDAVFVAHGYSSLAVQILEESYAKAKRIPYWTDGNLFVVLQDGLPVHVPAPPENGLNMGKWTGRAR